MPLAVVPIYGRYFRVYNFHPPLSTLPVALLSVALLCEAANIFLNKPWLSKVVAVNLTLGTLGLAAAFFSGYQASELANQTFQIQDDAISLHHTIGRIGLFMAIPTLAIYFVSERAKFNKILFTNVFRVLLLVLVCLVLVTGFYGGKLVFEHGAGVTARPPLAK